MPSGLKNSKKSLINIKSNDNKCFLWRHISHLNLVEKNIQEITEKQKKIVNKLDYEEIKFLVSKKIIVKLKDKTIFVLMWFL